MLLLQLHFEPTMPPARTVILAFRISAFQHFLRSRSVPCWPRRRLSTFSLNMTSNVATPWASAASTLSTFLDQLVSTFENANHSVNTPLSTCQPSIPPAARSSFFGHLRFAISPPWTTSIRPGTAPGTTSKSPKRLKPGIFQRTGRMGRIKPLYLPPRIIRRASSTNVAM
jgi:hypothetical protein